MYSVTNLATLHGLLSFKANVRAKVNQHPHWYLHLLELGLLVAIFYPRNVKIWTQDLHLVLGWDIYHS